MQESYLHSALYTREVEGLGLSVFSNVSLPKGTLIGIQMGGVILPTQNSQTLRTQIGDYSHQIHKYYHWAPRDKGDLDILDYMNHSCDPTAWIVGDMTWELQKDIRAHEDEITWDYATTESDPLYGFECRCGVSICRGHISGNDWGRLDLLLRYYPHHFASYLSRKIAQELANQRLDIREKKLYALDSCDAGVVRYFEIRKLLLQKKTKHSLVDIAEYANFGVGVRMDGAQQCCDYDSAKYRTAFVHPVILASGYPTKKVAIYGGGDFEIVRELRRYKSITHIRVVDWDEEFMELAKTHLFTIHDDAWKDQRVRVETQFTDVFEFMERGKDNFDVLFVDLSNNSINEVFKPGIGQLLKLRLAPKGKVVIQVGEISTTPAALENLISGLKHIREDFRYFWVYRRYIPFFGFEQGWVIATDDDTFHPLFLSTFKIDWLIQQVVPEKISEYSGAIHHALFSLPYSLKATLRYALGRGFLQFYID